MHRQPVSPAFDHHHHHHCVTAEEEHSRVTLLIRTHEVKSQEQLRKLYVDVYKTDLIAKFEDLDLDLERRRESESGEKEEESEEMNNNDPSMEDYYLAKERDEEMERKVRVMREIEENIREFMAADRKSEDDDDFIEMDDEFFFQMDEDYSTEEEDDEES